LLASLRDLHRNPHVLCDIPENFFEVASSPKLRGHEAAHTGRLARQTHPLRSFFEPYRVAQEAENVKHHVHMTECTFLATRSGTGLFRENVKIKL